VTVHAGRDLALEDRVLSFTGGDLLIWTVVQRFLRDIRSGHLLFARRRSEECTAALKTTTKTSSNDSAVKSA
jgi:hypothetical protein